MAHEMGLQCDGTNTAAADLSAKQFFGVKVTASKAVNLAGAGDPIYGILQDKPTSGQAANVAFGGVSKASCGAAVTAGAFLKVDANGQFIDWATSGSRVAQALEASGGINEIISVRLLQNYGA